MFEWNKVSEKNKVEGIKPVEIKSEVVEEVVEKKKETVVEEEYYTIYAVAKMLGVSNTLLRARMVEYGIKANKINGALMLSGEDLRNIKKYRVVDGVRKLACIEDFELCEDCMERILK